MKKIFLLIVALYVSNAFSQTSKEIIQEIKNDAVLQDINYNLNNYIKINEIAKVDNFNEEIAFLNNYNLSDFQPINFFIVGKVNDLFSTPLVFFPNGFKSSYFREGYDKIYSSDLTKKIKNVFIFKNKDKEYYLLEYNDYITFKSKSYNIHDNKYIDKFIAIEKNELLDLIKNIKTLEKEIVEFKSDLEKSKFKLLILQEDTVDNNNRLDSSIMIPIISNTNYELKKPFDFTKSISINDFNFNAQYKEIIDIDGKNLNISKIIYYKDEYHTDKLKAKISISFKDIKLLKINYKKSIDTYFKFDEGEYPNDTRSDAYYYYLSNYLISKNNSDLNNMTSDSYWDIVFKNDEKFNNTLDESSLKIDDLEINSDFDLNNLFVFPKLQFENNTVYLNEYTDKETNVGVAVLKMRDQYTGFFSNEIKNSLIFNLKKAAKIALDEKAKEAKTIQGNKKFISDMTKKYGKKYVDDAMNGDITMGMPEELLGIPLRNWVIKSRDEFPNGYNLYCNFSFNTARKLLITVKNKKVARISNW
ncbi:hypothetical protein ACFQZF_06110 [Flavobacterium myungsuense]|uniref:DUF3298 domain-containing protein n=1 Tax=Flavobacterium myungsuense TaxID=651823 RepID=A0ABW3J215_9FLAO